MVMKKLSGDIITMLNDIQLEEGLKFVNKLSNSHIHFQHLKMKVNIAGQTLSSSVAGCVTVFDGGRSSGF